MSHFATAFALIFVIEGLFYAIFPNYIQKMMVVASNMKSEKLRYLGATMMAFGVLLVWILQKL